MNLLSYAMRDIPDADGSDSAEEKNHNQKNEKDFDKSIAGFRGSSACRWCWDRR
jgi:hypothetical protein